MPEFTEFTVKGICKGHMRLLVDNLQSTRESGAEVHIMLSYIEVIVCF